MRIRIQCDPPISDEDLGEPPEGVQVDIVDSEHYTVDATYIAVAVITWASGIANKVISDWISNRVKDKGARFFQINGKQCKLEKKDIARLIDEVTSEQDNAAGKESEQQIGHPKENLPDYLL